MHPRWSFALLGTLTFAAAGCDPCGPPAEPVVELTIVLADGVATEPDRYVLADLRNGDGAQIAGTERPATTLEGRRTSLTLGACDGAPQHSGTFTLRAWVGEHGEPAPAAGVPQASATVDVTCAPEGGDCHPDRAVTLDVEPAP